MTSESLSMHRNASHSGSKGELGSWSAVYNGVLGALYMASKQPRSSSRTTVLIVLFQALQLLAIAISLVDDAQKLTTNGAISVVANILSAFTVGSAVEALKLSSGFLVGAWAVSTAWMLGLAILFFTIAWKFWKRKQQSRLQLQTLRQLAVLSATALVIPNISVQLSWVACSGPAEEAAGICWSDWHAPTAVLGILLMPLYIWICAMVLLSYVDHSLQRPTYGAKLHGRGDVLLLLAQAAVVAIFSLTSAEDTSSLWFRFVALAVLAAGWLNTFILWQPHIAGTANDIRAALGGAFAWATLCAFVVLASKLVDVTGLLFGGLLPAALLAGGAARLRRWSVQQLPLDKLQGMADAHRWALHRLALYARVRDNRVSPDLQVVVTVLGGGIAQERVLSPRDQRAAAMPGPEHDRIQRRKAGQAQGAGGSAADQDSDSDGSLASNTHNRSLGAKRALVSSVAGADFRSVQMTSQLRAALVQQAGEAFEAAAGLPGSQPLAHFVRSLFQRNYRNSRYTEFAALRAAKSSSPGFDVAFFVYQRHRQLNEAKANTNSSGEASLSAIDRLLYEQHSQEAADANLEWSIGQARLWGSLAEPSPHVDDLHAHTVTLASALLKADTAYNAMRRLNPNSSALLRAVGQYMMTMRGDAEAGELLLAQADRMEQVALQRSQQVVKRFVYGQVMKRGSTSIDETSASVTLSGSVHNLGQVLDANAAASHVFGCPRSALLSKRFPDLFPPVLSGAMDAAMYEYTSRGVGLDFQSASLRLVLSSSGALVPVVMQLAEVPSLDDDDVVNFQMILQAVHLPHEVALVQGVSDAYRIISMTAGGASSLGVDLSAVGGSGGVSLEEDVVLEQSLLRYFPELDMPHSTNLFGGLSLHVGLAALRDELQAPAAAIGAGTPQDTSLAPAPSLAATRPSKAEQHEIVQTDVLAERRSASPTIGAAARSIDGLQGKLVTASVHGVANAFLASELLVVCWCALEEETRGGRVHSIATVTQGIVNAQRAEAKGGARLPPLSVAGQPESKQEHPGIAVKLPQHATGAVAAAKTAPQPAAPVAGGVDAKAGSAFRPGSWRSTTPTPDEAPVVGKASLPSERAASRSGELGSPTRRPPLSPLGSSSHGDLRSHTDDVSQHGSGDTNHKARQSVSASVAPLSETSGGGGATAVLDDTPAAPSAGQAPSTTQPFASSAQDENPPSHAAAPSLLPSLVLSQSVGSGLTSSSLRSAMAAPSSPSAAPHGPSTPDKTEPSNSLSMSITVQTHAGAGPAVSSDSNSASTSPPDDAAALVAAADVKSGQPAQAAATKELPAEPSGVTFDQDAKGGSSGLGMNTTTQSSHFQSGVYAQSGVDTFDENEQLVHGRSGRGQSTRGFNRGAAASVANSMVSVGARLRLGLLGIVTNEVHPITRRVIKVLFLMCVVATLVVVVQLSVIAAQFNATQRQIGTVLTNERRAGLVVQSTVLAQVAALSVETGIPVLPAAQAEAVLLHTAEELEAATTRIIEDFEVLSGTDVAGLEATPITLLEHTAAGTDTQVDLTLSDACLWFVSHVRRAAPAFNTGDLRQTSLTTVLNSGINVLVPALIASGAERIALYSKTVQEDEAARVQNSSIVFAAVVLVSLAFIWAYMLLLDLHTQAMLGVLRFVPRTTASSMKQAAHNSLLARANDEAAGDKMDSVAFEGEFERSETDVDDASVQTGNFAPGVTGQMTARERKFRSSVRRRRIAATFLSLPVIIVGSMLLAMFFVQQSYRARIEQSAQRTYLTHRLLQDMFQYTTYGTALVSPTVLASLSAASSTVTLEQLDLGFAAQQTGMLDRLDQLLQGTSSGPIEGVTTTALDRDSTMGSLLLSDACEAFTPSVPGYGSKEGCRQQRNGVLVEGGLQSGILELVSIIRRGVGSILLAFSPTAVPATLPLLQGTAVQDAATGSSLLLPYLSTLTLDATLEQESELEDLGRREFALLIVTAVLFLLLLLGSVVCVFVPFAKRIGRQATATQVALAVLPPELLQRVPALQTAATAATRKVIVGQAGRDAARRGFIVESLRHG